MNDHAGEFTTTELGLARKIKNALKRKKNNILRIELLLFLLGKKIIIIIQFAFIKQKSLAWLMCIKQGSAVPFVQYNSVGVSLCPPDVITLELGEREKPVNPSARIKNNNNNKKKVQQSCVATVWGTGNSVYRCGLIKQNPENFIKSRNWRVIPDERCTTLWTGFFSPRGIRLTR